MYDLAVIGGGPGGYVAAIRGAQKGMKVLLVEKDALGGTCLNRGCIPTKSLVYDTKLFKAAKTSSILTGTEQVSLDMSKMNARKRKVVQTLVSGLGSIIKSNSIDLGKGTGELMDPHHVKVIGPNGSAAVHEARNIILANGSRPAVPPFITVDGIRVKTTDEALDSEDVPSKVLIIGGGVIGIEMAGIYLNMGCHVSIIELLSDVLLTEDRDVRNAMRRMLKKQKASVYLGAKAKEIKPHKKGVKVTFEDKSAATQTIETDQVLVATGRAPVFDGVDARKLGLALDGPYVKVNERLETNLPGIYAIGDLVGGMMLAHKASAEAEVAVDNILGANRTVKPQTVPRCIWGLSEIGAVGLSEEEAREGGRKIKIGRFPYAASGAAQAMGNVEGFVKIIGDADTGEILGVHILGEHATDLVSEAVTVMEMEGAVEDLYEAIKPHPTVSETIMEAALDWNGLAVHMPRKRG
jgi:dihydrolipoamide dehydrogenase